MTPAVRTEAVADRDAALRRAHRRAFDKIRAAADTAEREALVAAAVRELVDACESYLVARA
ncbi:MAG: hypothetical protein ACRDJ5_06870 [Actinomycetota bacterium]